MNESDKKLMQDYGITSEQRTVFFWKDYKYEKLADAVKYAKSVTERELNTGSSSLPDKT